MEHKDITLHMAVNDTAAR